MSAPAAIAVVIPCFRVRDHVLGVLAGFGPEVGAIYVVDDACPDRTGDHVRAHCTDPRVRVLDNPRNLGVGGAVLAGYRAAIDDGATVIVKVDGDGQMDPHLVPVLAEPVLRGEADYAKGNRFYDLEGVQTMPTVRLFGNAALSFMAKFSSGYWDLFDPTNGFTAIHAEVARLLPSAKISHRYFFETDMLFRLATFRAVVVDVPMQARYGDETSNLRIGRILGEFLYKHMRNTGKRIFYNYFLRDLSAASIAMALGVPLLTFGVLFGGWTWFDAARDHTGTPAGTVMLAALPILVGGQLLLSFLAYDMTSMPRRPLWPVLGARARAQHRPALEATSSR